MHVVQEILGTKASLGKLIHPEPDRKWFWFAEHMCNIPEPYRFRNPLLATYQGETTKRPDLLHGPIDELKASNILAGPFELCLTDQPSEHLTFAEVRGKTTLRILELDGIFRFAYRLQRTGVAK